MPSGVGRWGDVCVCLLLVLLAAVLRVPQIHDSLWLDELHTAWTLSAGWSDIPQRAAMGNNGPLYFCLPWLATSVWGDSEAALRLPSCVAGIGLVAGLYAVARIWTGSRWASLTAAFLAAIDPHCLFYSIEARTYSTVQLLGLLQLAAWVTVIGHRHPTANGSVWGWAVWGWAVSSALLFHLHPTTLLATVTQLVCLVAAEHQRASEPSRKRLVMRVAILVLGASCLPSMPHLWQLFQRREAWSQFVGIPSLGNLLTLFPLATYWGPALPFVMAARWHHNPVAVGTRLAPHRERLGLLLVSIFAPLLAAWLLTETDLVRLFFRRYLIVISPALFLVTALLIQWLPKSGWQPAASLVTCLVACLSVGPLAQWRLDGRWIDRGQEDWRAAVRFIAQEGTAADDAVWIATGLIEADRLHDPSAAADRLFQSFCSLPLTGCYRLPSEWDTPVSLPNHDVATYLKKRARLGSRDRVWLIVRGPAPQRFLAAAESAGFGLREQKRDDFGKITVFLLHKASK